MLSEVGMIVDLVTFVGLVGAFGVYDWCINHRTGASASPIDVGRPRTATVIAFPVGGFRPRRAVHGERRRRHA